MAADEEQLDKTSARSGRVALCVDELGCTELDRRDAEPLFQVLTERAVKCRTAVAPDELLGG